MLMSPMRLTLILFFLLAFTLSPLAGNEGYCGRIFLIYLFRLVPLHGWWGGDFNAIASLDEYRGPSSPDLGSISDFSGFIHQGAFLELPTSGGFHTWTGIRGSGRVHKKLDQLLFNSSWISAFSSSSLELLSKATSDHCPLLLKVPFHSQSVPKPFKFQSMWVGRLSRCGAALLGCSSFSFRYVAVFSEAKAISRCPSRLESVALWWCSCKCKKCWGWPSGQGTTFRGYGSCLGSSSIPARSGSLYSLFGGGSLELAAESACEVAWWRWS